jgi:hypothetical protein
MGAVGMECSSDRSHLNSGEEQGSQGKVRLDGKA